MIRPWRVTLVLLAISHAALTLTSCRESNTADAPETGTPASDAPTNVVMVLIDTLRADWLSVYGFEEDTSPELDRLASRGVVFWNAHAPAPWTLPAVTSLMTGRFPVEHGVVRDGQTVSRELPTLAETLLRHGYSTGSFHVNPYAGAMSGLDRGFEVCQQVGNAGLLGRVKDWLGGRPAPFFLYVHMTQPHDPPRHVSTEFRTAAGGQVEELEALTRDYRRLTRVDFVNQRALGATDNTRRQKALLQKAVAQRELLARMYSEAVREADQTVGRLVAMLQEGGQWENTLFVVLADHGEEMAEHGGLLHDQSVYEELVRVPLIMRFPDDEHAGRRVEAPVSLVNVAATVLEATDQIGQGLTGQSLLPSIDGDAAAPDELQVTAMRINRKKYYRPYKKSRGDINVVVRKGTFKGILNAELGSFELYDLSQDPGEQVDLFDQRPDVARSMGRFAAREWERLRARAVQVEDAGLGALDAETRQALQALGYVDPGDE